MLYYDVYIARPTYCFILMCTCGLTVAIERICYAILSSCVTSQRPTSYTVRLHTQRSRSHSSRTPVRAMWTFPLTCTCPEPEFSSGSVQFIRWERRRHDVRRYTLAIACGALHVSPGGMFHNCRATYTVRPTCDRDIRLRQTYQPLGQSSRSITLYYTCHSVETSAVFNGRHRSRPFGRMGTFIAQLDTEEMSEIKYSAVRIRTSHGHSQNVNHSSNFISARSILSTITDALISCCWRNAFNR